MNKKDDKLLKNNYIQIEYQQTGNSINVDEQGMREMQQRAFAWRDQQYLLLKAPPASGKSRALMFIALDKLHYQGIKKVIIAVPERAIVKSFAPTDLKSYGFFADWEPNQEYNLCIAGGSRGKIEAFKRFMENDEKILICAHATLRLAFEDIDESKFNDCLLVIDEFHHASADTENNKLGTLVNAIMNKSSAHIVAMTGSYFRGDGVPVLDPKDEEKFKNVTYNYYDQLNGYEHLKSLEIGYHFYQGKYTEAIHEVLDTNKKTIVHIPNVNAGESTKDKYEEVDEILGIMGEVIDECDDDTGIIHLKRKNDGKILKIADLVDEDGRDRVLEYLRKIEKIDDIDIIIALGMAKEGFDWPFCECALTVGYRGSLTEVVQIIGRCTRDSENKEVATFTNLIAQPDASDDKVLQAVNNTLKAITCSLLMEQVMKPNFNFKTRLNGDEKTEAGTIKVRGYKEPTSQRAKDIVESDIHDLKATILQNSDMQKAMAGKVEPEVINKFLIPKIIQEKYPDLSNTELEEVRQYVVTDSALKSAEIKKSGKKQFVRMAGKFVNIDELHIDLIDSINPFQDAFEVRSKSMTAGVFHVIQNAIITSRLEMTEEEALHLWEKMDDFIESNGGKAPNINAPNPQEVRYAQAILYIQNQRRQHNL